MVAKEGRGSQLEAMFRSLRPKTMSDPRTGRKEGKKVLIEMGKGKKEKKKPRGLMTGKDYVAFYDEFHK